MLTRLLGDIARIDAALGALGDGHEVDDALVALRSLERQLVAQCYFDGDVEVDATHLRAAVAIITAYLDGVGNEDGFALLASIVSTQLNHEGVDGSFLVGLVAILAKLCGDFAASSNGGRGPGDVAHGLRVVQSIAINGDFPTA